MTDRSDLPFQAEYAKSGRAGCKACSQSIEKDNLRLAVMIQSHHFDGKVPNWFHFDCFWLRAKCTKVEDIHGFDNLRWEDQEKIKNSISGKGVKTSGGDSVDLAYKEFCIEYAKSSRSMCRGCAIKIDKDLVRMSHKDYECEGARLYGPQDMWHHVECFVKKRDELGFTEGMDPTRIPGFKNLRAESKEEVISSLGKGDRRKRKAEASLAVGAVKKSKEEDDEEAELRAQNELVWKIRDKLQKCVSADALRGLLEFNDQESPSGESKLLDSVSDAMAFGALLSCPECLGQLRLSGSVGGYQCSGDATEWTKCQYVTQLPKRRPFKVPQEYHDVAFLKSYKYVVRHRLFPKRQENTANSSSDTKVKDKKPLTNLKVAVVGKLGMKQADAIKIIEELGGVVLKRKPYLGLTFIISSKVEMEKYEAKIAQFKEMCVPAVSEEFLNDAKNFGDEDLISIIQKHCISDWQADPAQNINDALANQSKPVDTTSSVEKKESAFTKNAPSTLKMTVKGGAAVDPDSGLENKAHVLQGKDKTELFNAVLGLVDITRGTNSFYKLQVLESDKDSKWWLFRAWGRVGTTIGGNKLERFPSKNNAIDSFKALYVEKTGNEWEDREDFVKVPNRFYPLDIDYGADEAQIKNLDSSAGSKSNLRKEVQDLIKLIFDIETMKRVMLEFEIDLKKMPLGKLSKKQIESAYKVLTELQKLLDTKGSATQILDASNRFYTLIPHDFGLKKPPLLDAPENIKSKVEMLDNLIEIEIAYNLLKTKSDDDSDKDILDIHYEKLKTDLEVLDKSSDEYKRIAGYMTNTHASTHDQYDLEILDVFVVNRHGESKVYQPFKDLHNRMLLWHGSRLTNFAGILSQGLRIAPPEAPVTGYMFGKGIYFADMVSKSANYCMTTRKNPTGLMLLSEVALGNMYELTQSEFVEKLPKGKQSTKGLGTTAPDPKGDFMCKDGTVIPMGRGIQTGIKKTGLLYNEYIVYDVAQANLKYLLKINFKYRRGMY